MAQRQISLTVKETWVRSLVQEDATCCREAKSLSHNYQVCTLECSAKFRLRGAETTEHHAASLKPLHQSQRSAMREATAVRSLSTAAESSPCSPLTKESPGAEQRPEQPRMYTNKIAKNSAHCVVLFI